MMDKCDALMMIDRNKKLVGFQAKTDKAIRFINASLIPRYNGEIVRVPKNIALNYYEQLKDNDFTVIICQVMRGGQYHGSS
jgi:hypothetical protein